MNFSIDKDKTPFLENPFLFIVSSVLPQIVLVLINLRYYSLVSGEIAAENNALVSSMFFSQCGLLIWFVLAGVVYLFYRRKAFWFVPTVSIFASIAYLWFFSVSLNKVWPNVPAWIAPIEGVLFYQFALVVPSLMLSVLMLSTHGIDEIKRKQLIVLASSLLGIPAVWYIFVYYVFQALRDSYGAAEDELVTDFLLLMMVVSTVILYGVLFRLFVFAYKKIELLRKKSAMLIFSTIFTIVFPIGGLLLNRKIPFPVDFQYWEVYSLTVFNGALLMLPQIQRFEKVLSILRAVMFPFTLYFFFVFLPFTPLSIPAIIIAGAGFLVLTPSVLFAVHLRRIIADCLTLGNEWSRRSIAVMLFLSLLVLPSFFIVRAFVDRLSINDAIRYVYEPDYVSDVTFTGNLTSVKRALTNVISSKAGDVLPILTGLYDYIVFDNLTLSDSKIQHLYSSFFGGSLEIKEASGIREFFGRRNTRVNSLVSPALPKDSEKVTAVEIAVEKMQGPPGFAKVKAVFMMKNLSESMVLEEYRAGIKVSDGVFVSGFGLYINGKLEPGRIFEKKTAMWVYEMIKNYRRDPGLLYYTSDNEMFLRIYPFNPGEMRTCEVDFIYPEGASPSVIIAGKKLALPVSEPGTAGLMVGSGSGEVVFLPASQIKGAKTVKRSPVLHFVVDWSKNSSVNVDTIAQTFQTAKEKFPDAEKFTMTYANYELTDSGLHALNAFNSRFAEETSIDVRKKGGFLMDRAVRHAIVRHGQLEKTFPIVIVIGNSSAAIHDEGGSYFKRISPDIDGYYITADGKKLDPFDYAGNPVSALDVFAVLEVEKSGLKIYVRNVPDDKLLFFPGNNGGKINVSGKEIAMLEVNDPMVKSAFSSFGGMVVKDTFPAKGNTIIRSLVLEAKKTGVLNGVSSYIVVESPSQWKVLEQKEKTKLENAESLDITDSPEPPVWLLAALLFVFIGAPKIFRKITR